MKIIGKAGDWLLSKAIPKAEAHASAWCPPTKCVNTYYYRSQRIEIRPDEWLCVWYEIGRCV